MIYGMKTMISWEVLEMIFFINLLVNDTVGN